MNTKKPLNRRNGFLTAAVFSGAIVLSGCGSTSLFSGRVAAEDQVNDPSRTAISDVMGPTERSLRNLTRSRRDTPAAQAGTDADLQKAQQQLEFVRQLYDDGKYVEAERAAKKLVNTRRATYESPGTRIKRLWGLDDFDTKLMYENFGDPVEEDALFLMAESQFAQRRLTRAQDSYDDLLNRYPSTRHMDRVTKQMFRMARYWLNFPNDLGEKSQNSEVQLASNEEAAEPESMPQSAGGPGFLPNLTDPSRPVFDSDGRGLQALRSIWLHDATGPLADDALMLAANHNLRVRNFIEAKRLYELLREQYPDSPHLKDAFLLGSHVTLASYEGPRYDGSSLAEARDLKQTMIQIFPDLTAQERKMLQGEIDQLHEAEIEKLWELVVYYKRKNVPQSIALHCHLIINRYPNSRYAQLARETLQDLNSKSNGNGNSFWAWGNGTEPASAKTAQLPQDSTDPRLKTSSTNGRDAEQAPPAVDADEVPKRSIFGFLRRAEEVPQLEPTPQVQDEAGRATL